MNTKKMKDKEGDEKAKIIKIKKSRSDDKKKLDKRMES
jgi:hypothetical protein